MTHPKTHDMKSPNRYWGSDTPKPKREFFNAVTTPPAADGSSVATIRMYGPIDSWGGWWGISTKDVGAVLDALPESVTEIVLRINSPGGHVFEGMSILNMLRAHKAKVTAVVDGLAASAASFIAAGCDETVMSPGTQMMIHSPSVITWGNAKDMRKEADILDGIQASIIEIYESKAGASNWDELLAEETWYTAAQAVEQGLADRVAVVPDAGEAATVGADDEDTVIIVTPLEDDATEDAAPPLRFVASAIKPPVSTEPGTPNRKDPTMGDLKADLRARLGINDADATDEQVLDAVDAALTAKPTTQTAALPAGVVTIEAATLEQMRTDAAAGREARDAQILAAREKAVDDAIGDGRIPPARRDAWLDLLAADKGASETLANLEKGVIPLQPKGHTGGVDEASDEDGHYSKLYPTKTTEA